MKLAWYGKTSAASWTDSRGLCLSLGLAFYAHASTCVSRAPAVSLDVDSAFPLCSSYAVWFSNMTRPPHSSRGMFCCWLRWVRALTLWRCEGSNVSFSSKRLMAKRDAMCPMKGERMSKSRACAEGCIDVRNVFSYRYVGAALSTHNEASRTPRAVVSRGTMASLFPSPKIPSVVTAIQSTSSYRNPPCTRRPSSTRRTTPTNLLWTIPMTGPRSHAASTRCLARGPLPPSHGQCPSELYCSSGMISDISPARYGISLSPRFIPVWRGQGNAASRFTMLIRSAMQALLRAFTMWLNS